MADERITASRDSLDSVKAYIETALADILFIKQLTPAGKDKHRSAVADLRRALQCLAEAPLTDEELRAQH